MREQMLESRHEVQTKKLQKLLYNQRLTPRTYETKKTELNKWMSKEKKLLVKEKKL